jgi:hypothetical protein
MSDRRQSETDRILSVQGSIHKVVNLYAQRFPHLDREELLGEAQIPALLAVRSYNPSKAHLSSWVSTCVWRHLSMSVKNATWQRRVRTCSTSTVKEVPDKEKFSLETLIRS